MDSEELRERVLDGWIELNSRLKDSRMTQSLTYNEAVVMKRVYDRYRADGVGRTSMQELLRQTNMLKSLMNRTLNALCAQGYLVKEREGRSLYVRPVPQRLADFLVVHRHSLELVERIVDVVGREDAEHFVRICQKLTAAELSLA